MPVYTYDAPASTDPPPPEKPPMIVCTLASADTGEACRYCGYASGAGHGKKRG
jgi:hypothetical protein